MSKVKVLVRLKEGVLDPQGKTVSHALKSLGFEHIEGVRIGKLLEIEMNEQADAPDLNTKIKAMCDKLLVNPVMEDYEILES